MKFYTLHEHGTDATITIHESDMTLVTTRHADTPLTEHVFTIDDLLWYRDAILEEGSMNVYHVAKRFEMEHRRAYVLLSMLGWIGMIDWTIFHWFPLSHMSNSEQSESKRKITRWVAKFERMRTNGKKKDIGDHP